MAKKELIVNKNIKFQQFINGKKAVVEAVNLKEAIVKFNLLKNKKNV